MSAHADSPAAPAMSASALNCALGSPGCTSQRTSSIGSTDPQSGAGPYDRYTAPDCTPDKPNLVSLSAPQTLVGAERDVPVFSIDVDKISARLTPCGISFPRGNGL